MSNGGDLERRYLEHRNEMRDLEFQDLLEGMAAQGQAFIPGEGIRGMAERPGSIPGPMAAPQKSVPGPPEIGLEPERVLPVLGRAAAAAPGAARRAATVAPAAALSIGKGALKAVGDVPRETLSAIQDLAYWIQGVTPEQMGLSELVTGERKTGKVPDVAKEIPAPGPSPEGSLEEMTRRIASFAIAFLGAGKLLKAVGLAKDAGKVAQIARRVLQPGAAAFITKEGGLSEKVIEWGLDQLPAGVEAPWRELLEVGPDDPAAVERFKRAVTNVIDVNAIPALIAVARALRGMPVSEFGHEALTVGGPR